MKKTELVNTALKNVCCACFPCRLYASDGGKCSDGWDGEGELELSADQLLYLISRSDDDKEYYEGLSMTEVYTNDILSKMAREEGCPDGGPSASVNDSVPDELQSLYERMNRLDLSDEAECDSIRQELQAIKDGDYTFHFTVVDGSGCYDYTDDAEETIHLTADEARSLLNGGPINSLVLKGICDRSLDEEFIDEKARQAGLAAGYETFDYWGSCERLDSYLESWRTIIAKIECGEITEENLDKWLEYFDDSDNYEWEIESWYEDNE